MIDVYDWVVAGVSIFYVALAVVGSVVIARVKWPKKHRES